MKAAMIIASMSATPLLHQRAATRRCTARKYTATAMRMIRSPAPLPAAQGTRARSRPAPRKATRSGAPPSQSTPNPRASERLEPSALPRPAPCELKPGVPQHSPPQTHCAGIHKSLLAAQLPLASRHATRDGRGSGCRPQFRQSPTESSRGWALIAEVEGRKLYVIDEEGKEHEMEIVATATSRGQEAMAVRGRIGDF